MNKHELTHELAQRCGLSEVESQQLFDATFTVLTETLSENQSVTIPDFGTFENHLRRPHKYFDLFRKRFMVTSKKLSVAFRPAHSFKEILHDLPEHS